MNDFNSQAAADLAGFAILAGGPLHDLAQVAKDNKVFATLSLMIDGRDEPAEPNPTASAPSASESTTQATDQGDFSGYVDTAPRTADYSPEAQLGLRDMVMVKNGDDRSGPYQITGYAQYAWCADQFLVEGLNFKGEPFSEWYQPAQLEPARRKG